MAIYHLSIKPIKRSDGRSATASSAYRSGTKIEDNRTGLTHDYTNKNGVVTTDCFALTNGEKIQLDRNKLWNIAEEIEKRKDSRTAREIVINIPHELPENERKKLVADFSNHLAEKYDCGIDYAIHEPDAQGDNRNHHAHIMMTTRNIEIDKNNKINLTNKTHLELSNRKLAELDLPKTQDQIKEIREEYSSLANERLEHNNIKERIDHRSHADRELAIKPTIKLGWQCTELERKGIKTDRGDINRTINAENEQIKQLENSIYLDKGRLRVQKQLTDIKTEPKQALERTEMRIKPILSRYEQWKQEKEIQEREQAMREQNELKPKDIEKEVNNSKDIGGFEL